MGKGPKKWARPSLTPGACPAPILSPSPLAPMGAATPTSLPSGHIPPTLRAEEPPFHQLHQKRQVWGTISYVTGWRGPGSTANN